MMTHPFIRQPMNPMTHPGAPLRPPAPIAHQMNPLGQQRSEVALGLQRQRALAQALRGGTGSGVPMAPANPGIMRPAGIPQVR